MVRTRAGMRLMLADVACALGRWCMQSAFDLAVDPDAVQCNREPGGTRCGVRTLAKPTGWARRRFCEGEKLRAASGQGLVRAEPALTQLSCSMAHVTS